MSHPERDTIIAKEMGWEHWLHRCGGVDDDCAKCEKRFDCEAYEMLLLMSDPASLEGAAEVEEMLACFEQVREIPAYYYASRFASRLEDALRGRVNLETDEEAARAMLNAQMVAAQIAGGHGIGYERDSICGNIANCKRAMRSLRACLSEIECLELRQVLTPAKAGSLRMEADRVSCALNGWIENLRSRIWWR